MKFSLVVFALCMSVAAAGIQGKAFADESVSEIVVKTADLVVDGRNADVDVVRLVAPIPAGYKNAKAAVKTIFTDTGANPFAFTEKELLELGKHFYDPTQNGPRMEGGKEFHDLFPTWARAPWITIDKIKANNAEMGKIFDARISNAANEWNKAAKDAGRALNDDDQGFFSFIPATAYIVAGAAYASGEVAVGAAHEGVEMGETAYYVVVELPLRSLVEYGTRVIGNAGDLAIDIAGAGVKLVVNSGVSVVVGAASAIVTGAASAGYAAYHAGKKVTHVVGDDIIEPTLRGVKHVLITTPRDIFYVAGRSFRPTTGESEETYAAAQAYFSGVAGQQAATDAKLDTMTFERTLFRNRLQVYAVSKDGSRKVEVAQVTYHAADDDRQAQIEVEMMLDYMVAMQDAQGMTDSGFGSRDKMAMAADAHASAIAKAIADARAKRGNRLP